MKNVGELLFSNSLVYLLLPSKFMHQLFKLCQLIFVKIDTFCQVKIKISQKGKMNFDFVGIDDKTIE